MFHKSSVIIVRTWAIFVHAAVAILAARGGGDVVAAIIVAAITARGGAAAANTIRVKGKNILCQF